jgi:hypothetical protein
VSAFQRFVVASGLTNLADGIATVAWAWLASALTRDPVLIGLVAVALRLPWFLFALPAGIITDRMDRRVLIIAMDVVRATGFALAALSVWLALPLAEAPARGVSSSGLYLAITLAALLVGCAEVFRDNAAQTMIPALVPEDQLERANGRLWSVEMIGNALIGPALGAALIAFALPFPFVVNALAYALAVWLVASVQGSFRAATPRERNWRAELGEGLAFLKGVPLLKTMAVLTGFWNLFHQMMVIALVLHVQENLNLPAETYGLVLAGGAIGGILGSLLGARVAAALGPLRTMQWMLLATPFAFVWIALAGSGLWVAVALGFMELTGLIWNVVSVSMRQRMIPDALLGRVNSIYRLLAWGMMPVGLILSGVIVRLGEGPLLRADALVLPFWGAAIGLAVVALLGWRALARGFAGK